MNKKIAHYIRNKYVLGGIGLLILIVIISIFSFGGSGKPLEIATVKVGSIIEKVTVTGKVAPYQKADLGFEKGGILAKVNVKVGDPVKAGDLIASLDGSDSYASLQGAEANLLSEQARLTELQKGLRPEELTVEEAKVKSAETSNADSKTVIINAFHDSYIKTENAIFNYADTLFTNPQSVLPIIKVRTESYNQQNNINNQRVIVGEKLRAWKASLDSMTLESDPNKYLNDIHSYLEITKNFLSTLSSIVSKLTTGDSGMTQSAIDAYVLTVNTSLSTLNGAITSLATGESTYSTASSNYTLAQEQYLLKKAGSSQEALQAQQAKVSQASANVLGYQVELAKKRILSPIDGIVSKVDAQIGEFISAGQIEFGVIGDQSYKVEINVPEVDIVKIAVNNPATIELDAYGSDITFDAHVVSIDPAETIVEGVPTYKVTMQFDKKDERIRSGMTANIDIVTQSKDNVITIPARAIFEKNKQKLVRLMDENDASDYTEVPVVAGIRGSNGMIEIISGLKSGDRVVTLLK